MTGGATGVTATLAGFTTLGVGGPARRLVEAGTEREVIAAVRAADIIAEPVLLLGGGSNLVVADSGFPGTAVRITTRGITADSDLCGGTLLRVAAGEPWDDLVAMAVTHGWSGLECLSGIPGSTGATPVQNVGAYGAEVADTIASVRTYDRVRGLVTTFAAAECAFGYRDSVFKRTSRGGPGGGDRYVVLEVTFQLPVADLSAPLRYAELARSLGEEVGARVPLPRVRDAVLALRRSKAMVLDPADPDTRSVGSFFTNPVVEASRVPDGAPSWPARDGMAKVPAAWLIEQAGISRGYGLPGPAAVSTRHTLALTNRGDATAADVVRLAREVRSAVESTFGITLEPEPRLVGLTL